MPALRELSVEHNWVGAEAARPPVSFQPVAGRPYGRILVPIVIEASRPADYSLRLEIEARSKGRQAWPSDWAQPRPRDVQIGHDDWRPNDQQRFAFTLCIDVPTRMPSGAVEALELDITLHDGVSSEPLSHPKRLRWDAVERDVTAIALEWPEGVKPRYVETHPIGPQKRTEQIVTRVESGSSFAVVAPRRFGKSTLIEYLAERFRSMGCVVPQPIVCTEFFDSAGFDHLLLWREVSKRLQKELGSTLEPELDAGIPHPEAFDYVRRAAHKGRKRAVVLLFDESQLFFTRIGGAETGDRLKDRLERYSGGNTATERWRRSCSASSACRACSNAPAPICPVSCGRSRPETWTRSTSTGCCSASPMNGARDHSRGAPQADQRSAQSLPPSHTGGEPGRPTERRGTPLGHLG